jgi:hypothetical protein
MPKTSHTKKSTQKPTQQAQRPLGLTVTNNPQQQQKTCS